MLKNKIIDSFLGLAIGDALGVPVEFLSRESIHTNPVQTMRAYGTHQQPAGTWSDDSSMAFCLAESLCNGYDLEDIANNFVKWRYENFWTPHGLVFDIGIATSSALQKIKNGLNPILSGGVNEKDNGNGSLMRILPIIFYLKNKSQQEKFKIINEVSCITHAHIRSVLSCFIYCEFALELLAGKEKFEAYKNMQKNINDFIKEYQICDDNEKKVFKKILENDMSLYFEDEIESSGYVLHTLEASIWCFLKTKTYSEAVLKAVNLGNDTDTTGCVTGGLAGLYYGSENIPTEWINILAKKDEIINLATKMSLK